MQKVEGLAKAAVMMGILAGLATLLAVSAGPPPERKARAARGREARMSGIPVPGPSARGGVGAAQERGTAVERREAGGGRAPANSPGMNSRRRT